MLCVLSPVLSFPSRDVPMPCVPMPLHMIQIRWISHGPRLEGGYMQPHVNWTYSPSDDDVSLGGVSSVADVTVEEKASLHQLFGKKDLASFNPLASFFRGMLWLFPIAFLPRSLPASCIALSADVS